YTKNDAAEAQTPVISEFVPMFTPEPMPSNENAAMLETGGGVKNMQDHLREAQSDAPACNVCGHITMRSGTCYKCLNCGNSLGCS
ncbi:MAG: hypothetical protein FJY15_03620, partial [Bacteroidetes bacterium]|nr:hypothetical protein [Bacteroidota bacterium]